MSGQLHASVCFALRTNSICSCSVACRKVWGINTFLAPVEIRTAFSDRPACALLSPSKAVLSHMKPAFAGISHYSCHTEGRDKGDICTNEPWVGTLNVIRSVRCAVAVVCTHRHVHTVKLSVTHKAWTLLHVSAINRHLEGESIQRDILTF